MPKAAANWRSDAFPSRPDDAAVTIGGLARGRGGGRHHTVLPATTSVGCPKTPWVTPIDSTNSDQRVEFEK
jgi:hypothetical protein